MAPNASHPDGDDDHDPFRVKDYVKYWTEQKREPPQPAKPTPDEEAALQHYLTLRDRIHEGPFYTLLNDGMKTGLKRKANEPAPTEAQMFNPFTDNQTYSSKYLKVRRKLPKLDTRPYGESALDICCWRKSS